MESSEDIPDQETRPESPFEAASYDLNKFRERRLADRRFCVRASPDRRASTQLRNRTDISDLH